MSSMIDGAVNETLDKVGDGVLRMFRRVERDGQRATHLVPHHIDALPLAGARLAVFVEFEACACTVDTETLLLPGVAPALEREARQEQYATLHLPMEQALMKLEASGAALSPGFIHFAEACCAHDAALHILSRGFKPIISHFLEAAGLGHLPVIANEVSVPPGGGAWKLQFRDDSVTGHDKARSVKHALPGIFQPGATPTVVLVGNSECDAAPIKAGLVHLAYAGPSSKLARYCEGAGFRIRPFADWRLTQRDLFVISQ